MERFTCPRDASHTKFYARHYESFAHEISASGVDMGELKNSMDGNGWDPVMCATCDVAAVDATPGKDFEDE